jgi:hypothetical protein
LETGSRESFSLSFPGALKTSINLWEGKNLVIHDSQPVINEWGGDGWCPGQVKVL